MTHRLLRPRRWTAILLGAAAVLAAGPEGSAAQVVGLERLVTADGIRLDFTANGVWRRKAARVADYRRRLKAQALFDALNAAAQGAPTAPAAAVTGTLHMPSVLLAFNDTQTSELPPTGDYDALFYGDPSSLGRPYSIRTYYEELSYIDEMSSNLFTVDGQTYGWVTVAHPATYYLDACPGANPLDCSTGLHRFGAAFREVLDSLDASVDFSQYDNDGPDDVPNSGDDDGVVDVVQFVQPVLGGECGGPGMWAHKSNLGSVAGVFTTDDPAAGGGSIKVDSYYVVSGVGGPDCVASPEIMAIGISTHELGHGLGLPDLYDTGGSSAGIGEWGLMGSGIYTSLNSPAHFSAWSKEQMGWVTVREIAAGGTVSVGPVATSDTVFLLRPQGADPRGEYLLLENKQPVLADTANLFTGGSSGPKVGGLLVWHVDSAKIEQSADFNNVNVGSIHGVALVEADGRASLLAGRNRGDAGDPYPGSSGNLELAFATVPAALKNADGSFMGIRLDAFQQVVPDDEMQFRVTFGYPAVVRATDTAAVVSVDGVDYARFFDLLETGRSYTISIPDVQITPNGRSEFTFQAWSDAGARTHTIMDLPSGDSAVAQVAARHRILAAVSGSGSVSAVSGIDVASGVLLDEGSSVTLVAAPAQGYALDGWIGDTTALGDTLSVLMDRPFDVTAEFRPVVVFLDSSLAPATMGAPYAATLRAVGGLGAGTYTAEVLAGGLPAGVQLLSATDGAEISGIPEATGGFDLTVRLNSGNLQATLDVQLVVGAPALDVDRLVDQLFDGTQDLTADESRFLDLLGNKNGVFDLGDFLAWVDAGYAVFTGAAAAEAPTARPGSPRRVP